MRFRRKSILAIGIAVLALAVGGGAAFAHFSSADRDAFLNDVAERLGVEREALDEAIQGAQIGRIDAAEEEGLLTPEQADEARQRVESGEGGLFGFGRGGLGFRGGFGFRGPGGGLEAAAEVLDMTTAELREALRGSTVNEVAGDQAAAVEQAIVDAQMERIAEKAERRGLSEEHVAELEAQVESRVDALMERAFPEEGGFFGRRPFGHERSPEQPAEESTTGTLGL